MMKASALPTTLGHLNGDICFIPLQDSDDAIESSVAHVIAESAFQIIPTYFSEVGLKI